MRSLRAGWRAVDDHLLQSVAIDLVLALAERPEQYDPRRGGLASYLRMAARRDVQNLLRSERRRARRQRPVEDVELAGAAENNPMDATTNPAELVARSEPIRPELAALLRASFDQTEWGIVQLMLSGERRTAVYAQALDLRGRSELEQTREVKRVKDRLQKRLQRLASKVRPDA